MPKSNKKTVKMIYKHRKNHHHIISSSHHAVFAFVGTLAFVLIYQSHSFEGQERCLKSLEVYSSPSAARARNIPRAFQISFLADKIM